MRGHMWTALLNPIDRPPTPSIFFRTSLPRLSFHLKPLHYSSHSPLILISMFLLISGDIHPNPGPINPCSVCSRRVTWGNRSIQCTGCSLWVHLSCSGLSPADFRKISPGHSWTCPMYPSSSQPLPSLSHSNPVSSFFFVSPSSHTPNPPPPLTNNHKTISSKTKPSPKTTSNKPTYLPNHPQLIYTCPPSALTTPSPQTQHTTSPLTQSSFHPSSPSRNNLRILQWNANGICPRRTELLHFLSHNQYDLIFIQESHLSSDSTFRIPGYKTLQKNRFMTRRGTTNSTGNLGGGVLILVKNGLSYTSLSTQSLSSLDPSSDYLAIAVKIKGAAPIHLFNVYVPPIRSSSSDSRPKSFSPFLLPSSPTTYILGDFNSHHSSWDSHSPEDHSGKDLFDWLLSSDLLPLNNPEHHTLLHRATGNCSSPDLFLVPAQIASKCTWQTLPDLGSDHLPISITIPTSPIINSFHRPPHLIIIKLAGMITLLILIPTALLPLTLQHFLFLKPPTPLPNSSMMLPLLPFLSAASTALLKPGGLLKSQMPSQNAERHTVPKKTASTISLLPDIPPL